MKHEILSSDCSAVGWEAGQARSFQKCACRSRGQASFSESACAPAVVGASCTPLYLGGAFGWLAGSNLRIVLTWKWGWRGNQLFLRPPTAEKLPFLDSIASSHTSSLCLSNYRIALFTTPYPVRIFNNILLCLPSVEGHTHDTIPQPSAPGFVVSHPSLRPNV